MIQFDDGMAGDRQPGCWTGGPIADLISDYMDFQKIILARQKKEVFCHTSTSDNAV
jgi:hypothetical protein